MKYTDDGTTHPVPKELLLRNGEPQQQWLEEIND
jgi:hypothetical protein